jgi:DNA helicase-2/ATP-dependent DNA helicase PcrA
LIVGCGKLKEIIDKVFAPYCSGQKQSDTISSLKKLLEGINDPSLAPARQLAAIMEHYGPIMKVKYKKDSSRTKELVMLQQMAQRYATLKDFLADVAVDPDKDAKEGDLEFLTLSTVHSAKGLEWGRVFLIGLVDGVFPSGRSMIDGDNGDMEEEKRLFYVAVTRAKEELFLSFFNKNGTGERAIASPCRFLDPENVGKAIEERKVVAVAERPSPRHYPKYGRR